MGSVLAVVAEFVVVVELLVVAALATPRPATVATPTAPVTAAAISGLFQAHNTPAVRPWDAWPSLSRLVPAYSFHYHKT